MKKIILKSIIFLTLFIVPFTILNIVVERTTSRYDYYKLHFNEIKTNKTDANSIIIGMSTSLHGIQPKLLNNDSTTYFNFSLNGATAEYYKKWYDHIFKPFYKVPTQIIICVDLSFLDNAPFWRQYEQDAQYFPVATFVKHLLDWKETNSLMLIKNRFPVTKHLRNIFSLSEENNNPFLISQYEYGYIPYEKQFKDEPLNLVRKNYSLAYRNVFEKMVSELQQDGVKILFIQMPEYTQQKKDHNTININQYYDSISKSLDIPFLNYNNEKFSLFNSKKEYYSDRIHLNHRGSTIFTTLLRNDLDSLLIKPKFLKPN